MVWECLQNASNRLTAASAGSDCRPLEKRGNAKRMGTPKQRTYYVFNQTGESFVGLNIPRTDTALARLRGLLGHFRMKSGEGLWLVPAYGIHTIGLLTPVDLIYLDAQHRVIHLVEHLSPFRIAPIRLKSSSVLALPPHTIYSSQTHVGDQLLISPLEEMDAYLKKAVSVSHARGPDGKGAELEDAV
jgi:uncharacterized membrane protein (UPF0127 family)